MLDTFRYVLSFSENPMFTELAIYTAGGAFVILLCIWSFLRFVAIHLIFRKPPPPPNTL